MSSFDWERFLRQWSQELIASIGAELETLPAVVIESGWLGYPGATEEQIAQVETHLGITLPPSYREFLKVTNGWRQTTPFIYKLWSTESIEWFSVRHSDWIDAFEVQCSDNYTDGMGIKVVTSASDQDYFIYGDEQDCSKIRLDYLHTALEISERGESAIYLLNPQVVTEEGEWEAWFFCDWLPGADRYRSFQEMMQAEYENFLEQRETSSQQIIQFGNTKARTNHKPEAEVKSSPQQDTDITNTIETPVVGEDDSPQPSTEIIDEAAIPSPLSQETNWSSLSTFTIEFQTRGGTDQTKRRARVRHVETGTIKTWSSIENMRFHRWILEQANQAMQSLLANRVKRSATEAEMSAKTTPVVVEILQIRAVQPPQTDISVRIDKAAQPHSLFVSSNKPFALKITFRLAGLARDRLAGAEVTCIIQFYTFNLHTGTTTHLGNTRSDAPLEPGLAYVVTLPKITLQPGLYRLQILAILQGTLATPGYLDAPLLQVV
jgi:SMI1 / KNR4 family (SUKH-1)